VKETIKLGFPRSKVTGSWCKPLMSI